MTMSFVEMGICNKPHGIKGAFQFQLYNQEDSNIKVGTKIKLVPLNRESSLAVDGEFFTVKSIKFGNKIICFFEEIDNRNRVEEIIPFKIFLDRNHFEETSDNEFYLSDLAGLDVLNIQKEKIGNVKSFYDHGAAPVLVIEHLNGQITELPFVESFFPEVELEEKYIVMINPEIM